MTVPGEAFARLAQRVAALEAQRVDYLQADVTAVDTVGGTFTASVAGQADGADVPVAGIPAPEHFMPSVGDTVTLARPGAQLVYQPGRIADGVVGYTELADPVTQDIAIGTGKNKVTYSPNAASLAVPGDNAGDLWYQHDDSWVVLGAWQWDGAAWQATTLSSQVIDSITAGQIATGELTAVVTNSGVIQSSAAGARYVLDGTSLRFYDASENLKLDFDTLTGTYVFSGTVEAALFRTAASGQRLEITPGSRALNFYPASGTGVATFNSVDDGAGNAGVSAAAGGTTHGFLNFTSGFADLGFTDTGGVTSFMRVSGTGIDIGIESGKGMTVATDQQVTFFTGPSKFAELRSDSSLWYVNAFVLGGTSTAFTFSSTGLGVDDADVYASRFISTQSSGTGGFIYFSDGRLKEDIVTASFDAMSAINGTPVRSFTWKATGLPGMGLIAQESPPAAQVHLSPDQPMSGIADPLAVSADVLVIYCWKGLQEVDARIDSIVAALGLSL